MNAQLKILNGTIFIALFRPIRAIFGNEVSE